MSLFCAKLEPSTEIDTKLETTWFYLIIAFLKNKKRSGTSLPASFSAWHFKKNSSLVIFWSPFLILEILSNIRESRRKQCPPPALKWRGELSRFQEVSLRWRLRSAWYLGGSWAKWWEYFFPRWGLTSFPNFMKFQQNTFIRKTKGKSKKKFIFL